MLLESLSGNVTTSLEDGHEAGTCAAPRARESPVPSSSGPRPRCRVGGRRIVKDELDVHLEDRAAFGTAREILMFCARVHRMRGQQARQHALCSER